MTDETESISESELIVQVLKGDTSAFRVLVLSYQSLVFAMIMRQVGNRAVASDLTQDTFVRAYSKLHTFRSQAKFSTWLVRIALNATHSYLRSKSYRMEKGAMSLEAVNEKIASSDTHEKEETEVQLSLLRLEIQKLPRHYREAVVLAGLEGRSYEDTARLLEIPVGTVRSRLNAARNLLRKALGGRDL